MISINYILGATSITVFLKSKTYTVTRDSKIFHSVLNAIKTNDEDQVLAALEVKQNILSTLKGAGQDVQITDGEITYRGRKVTGLISTRIFEMLRLELDIQPMVKFLQNLMQNPASHAIDEALSFGESCSLPITPDGCFLAYKRVNEDYYDVHSRSVLNKPANLLTDADKALLGTSMGATKEVLVTVENGVTVVSMPRNLVNDNRNQTCSTGLHFCSYEYLSSFGGERIVVVKVNPTDIVSIPSDYNNSKGRCSRYEVVGELETNEGSRGLPVQALPDGYTNVFSEDATEDETSVVQSAVANGIMGAVPAIRRELDDGASLTSLALKYNTSRRTIARIRDFESPYNF